MMKKTLALVLAITGIFMLSGCGGKDTPAPGTGNKPAQTTAAEEKPANTPETPAAPEAADGVTLDEATGVLTLGGTVTREDILAYSENEKVTSIVAAGNCVLPEDCTSLFAGIGDGKTFWTNVTAVDLSKADASKVTKMGALFSTCNALTTVNMSNMDTSNVTDMTCMFLNCFMLSSVDMTNIDTSNVTSMEGMFWQALGLTSIDLSSFDTSKVTNMKNMFQQEINLETIYVSDKWTADNVTESDGMFANSIALVGSNGTKFDEAHTDKEYARIDTPDAPGYFTLK